MKRMKRILIAEDDPQVAAFVERALSKTGRSITLASDGNAALRELDRGDFDLVITDVVLPKVNGYEILRIAAKRMPVIVMTGNQTGVGDSELFEMTSSGLGATRTLCKPFRLNELLDAVEELLPSPVPHEPKS